ncbi:unnamed protein product [Prorocentrum cordatum]|uniref:Uncharacterized protein n=1 Tax=Prorocentrum cordatum TaxID=2364126 RepID=A0ABN9TT68_9DINO|nr:unnamed protein product [Polarella glacialis]
MPMHRHFGPFALTLALVPAERLRGPTDDIEMKTQAIIMRHFTDSDEIDNAEDMDEPADTDELTKRAVMLIELRGELFPSQTFTQIYGEQVLQRVADDREKDWALADEAVDWACSRSRMIRAMLRRVSQSATFRTAKKEKDASPGYAEKLEGDPDEPNEAEVRAMWKGGVAKKIPGLTFGKLRSWLATKGADGKTKKKKGNDNLLLEKKHVKTGMTITATRFSRLGQKALAIWEEVAFKARPKMVMQMALMDGMEGHEEFVKGLANKYIEGCTTKEEMETAKKAEPKPSPDEDGPEEDEGDDQFDGELNSDADDASEEDDDDVELPVMRKPAMAEKFSMKRPAAYCGGTPPEEGEGWMREPRSAELVRAEDRHLEGARAASAADEAEPDCARRNQTPGPRAKTAMETVMAEAEQGGSTQDDTSIPAGLFDGFRAAAVAGQTWTPRQSADSGCPPLFAGVTVSSAAEQRSQRT